MKGSRVLDPREVCTPLLWWLVATACASLSRRRCRGSILFSFGVDEGMLKVLLLLLCLPTGDGKESSPYPPCVSGLHPRLRPFHDCVGRGSVEGRSEPVL